MRPSIDAASEVGTPLPGWANAPNGMHLGRDTLTVLQFLVRHKSETALLRQGVWIKREAILWGYSANINAH